MLLFTRVVGEERLRSDLQRAYRLLALHPGADLEAEAAAALIADSPEQAVAMIEELVAANLLLEPEPGRYRFHDLVRLHAATVADDPSDTAGSAAPQHR